MNNFQLIPCTDNLIFAFVNYCGEYTITKRAGLIIEAFENGNKQNKLNNYRTLYLDEEGTIVNDTEVLDQGIPSYEPICHPGEKFTPIDFRCAINAMIASNNSLIEAFKKIEKLGGIPPKAPEKQSEIYLTVEEWRNELIFETIDDFYSLGDILHTTNPFIDTNDANDTVHFLTTATNVSNIADALNEYRKYFNRPNLKVNLKFTMDRSIEDNDKGHLHYPQWKQILERMINEGLPFDKAKEL